MNSAFYRKLVDLYAGRELPEDLENEMELAARTDVDLRRDMSSLRSTVELLHRQRGSDFTEESYQRILIQLYAKGANIEPRAQDPMHLQYQLPIQG